MDELGRFNNVHFFQVETPIFAGAGCPLIGPHPPHCSPCSSWLGTRQTVDAYTSCPAVSQSGMEPTNWWSTARCWAQPRHERSSCLRHSLRLHSAGSLSVWHVPPAHGIRCWARATRRDAGAFWVSPLWGGNGEDRRAPTSPDAAWLAKWLGNSNCRQVALKSLGFIAFIINVKKSLILTFKTGAKQSHKYTSGAETLSRLLMRNCAQLSSM